MACKVKVNRHGFLAFHLFWNGQRSWEGSGLRDTVKNRKRVEARAVLISEEIENGIFDYLKRFPDGNMAHLLRPAEEPKIEEPIHKTVGEYFGEWIISKKPPVVRKSLERDYRQHYNSYIKPQFQDIALLDVTPRFFGEFSHISS